MNWTLSLKQPPPIRVDARHLAEQVLKAETIDTIANIPIAVGRRTWRLDDWFQIARDDDADDARSLRMVGDFRAFDFLGSELAEGNVIIQGDVGAAAGHAMRGGSLRIEGNAGDYAAMAMRGGRIRITGDVGHHAGAPQPGERSGMAGGLVAILGNAGNGLGYRLRRGTIIVGGSVGTEAGGQMVAGTIIIGGTVGAQAALGMRRGTWLLLQRPTMPIGFTEPRHETPSIWPLLRNVALRELPADSTFHKRLADRELRLWRVLGDQAAGGMGEILWPDA